ncbi:reverse transcriptase domain-containing protein [Tanacetum coccineum]
MIIEVANSSRPICGDFWEFYSYVMRVKNLKSVDLDSPAIVLDEECALSRDLSSSLMGRIKNLRHYQSQERSYERRFRGLCIPRTAIKGQILADFIVERPEEGSPDELMAEPEVLPDPWTLFTDGSSCSCVDGSGAGLILTNPEGAEFTYAMKFRFEATNNEAEYKALIAGLQVVEQMGVKNLQAHVDSRLVANQVNGSYIAKESGMVHVSLTFSEAGVLHVNWISFGHCVLRRGLLC